MLGTHTAPPPRRDRRRRTLEQLFARGPRLVSELRRKGLLGGVALLVLLEQGAVKWVGERRIDLVRREGAR